MAHGSIAQMRTGMQRARMRTQHELAKREHTLLSTTAAAALGVAEAKGHKLPSIWGLDGTIVAGTVALIAADKMSGGGARMLQSFADGMLAIGAYKMGRSVGGAAIAGASDDAAAMDALLSTT
jgi:hypothetical protein